MLGGEGFGVVEEEVGAVQAAFERHDSPAEVRVVLLDLLQPERRKRRRWRDARCELSSSRPARRRASM